MANNLGNDFRITVDLSGVQRAFTDLGKFVQEFPKQFSQEMSNIANTVIGPKSAELLRSIAAPRIKISRTGQMMRSISFAPTQYQQGSESSESGTIASVEVGYFPTGGPSDITQSPIVYIKAVEKGWTQRRKPPASRLAFYATGQGFDELTPSERRRFQAIARSMVGKTYAGKHTLDALIADSRLLQIISDGVGQALLKSFSRRSGSGGGKI